MPTLTFIYSFIHIWKKLSFICVYSLKTKFDDNICMLGDGSSEGWSNMVVSISSQLAQFMYVVLQSALKSHYTPYVEKKRVLLTDEGGRERHATRWTTPTAPALRSKLFGQVICQAFSYISLIKLELGHAKKEKNYAKNGKSS